FVGFLDENCACVGDTILTDTDSDGIIDCLDPCVDCFQNDNNGNGICDCDEDCPPISGLDFYYEPVVEEACDYCVGVLPYQFNLLQNVILIDSNGVSHNLKESNNFSFPYCSNTIDYACEINGNEYYSLKRFISDFYYWYSNYDDDFRIVILRDSNLCDPYYNINLSLQNTKISDIFYEYEFWKDHAFETNCDSDTIGYNVFVDISDLSNCQTPSYQWSNGSTEHSVFLADTNFGFMVTVTCSPECSYA